MSEISTYKELPHTKNILSSLIENVNNDILFQKYVNKLQLSKESSDNKKACMLRGTMESIRVFGSASNPLFLATDVGILMGISHVHLLIKKFEQDEKVMGYMELPNGKTKKIIFLTKLGVYRCFFASRSPLAKLFRKFIVNLVDHVISYESDLLKKISDKFQVDNPELIENGINDLYEKLDTYQNKYIEEKNKIDDLSIKYKEIKQENMELDIAGNKNMMYIEQLKTEKHNYLSRIKHMQEVCEDENSIDIVENKLMREKYLRPIYLYIFYPTYLKSLLVSAINRAEKEEKKEEKKEEQSESDSDDDESKNIANIKSLLKDIKSYEKNFTYMTSEQHNERLLQDEILYYYIGFSAIKTKENKLICVNKQRVMNKTHFDKTIEELKKISTYITLNSNKVLFKTSIEEVKGVIQEQFISLNKK